jgi:hypothetical protein
MIKKFFKNLLRSFKAFEENPAGKRVIRLLSILFTTAIAAYLVYKLTLIGWDKVWQSLPHTPWFYLLLLIMFFSLPMFQVLIYRVAWKVNVKPWELFLALLNKRVLDKDVLGYSGEMYLYFWARKYVKQPDKEILHVLKDNVILSSAASTLVAAVLLLLFFALGRVKLPKLWVNPNIIHVVVLAFCGILIIGLVITFRKRILFLKRKEILAIFGLHICRLLFVQGLQVVQWAVVMPEIPILNWMTLLAVQIIITRIPLLPSRDLVFMGTGIEMSGFIEVSTPSMAGMLLASSVINKILNLFFFVMVFLSTRKRGRDF